MEKTCEIIDCSSTKGQLRTLTTFDNKTFKVNVCTDCLDKFDSPEQILANCRMKEEVTDDDDFYVRRPTTDD